MELNKKEIENLKKNIQQNNKGNSDILIEKDKEIKKLKESLQKSENEIEKEEEILQTIDENKQRTKKVKELPIESPGSIEEYNLYSVYELLNDNLVSCNTYGIKYIKKI